MDNARKVRGIRTLRAALRRLAVAIVLLTLAAASGAEIKLDSLQVGSKVYHHVIVLGVNDTDLYFRYDGGITNVRLRYLDPALQQRFGYDPKVAEAAELQQMQSEIAYSNALVQAVATAAAKQLKAARDAAASSEDSLADPISDRSLLRKPAPALTAAKWLTDPPVTNNRVVLVFFWTTWSVPCQKFIPQLNAWQKKYGDRLVVVGLSPQEEKQVEEFNGPKLEFVSGVDPRNKLADAVGATSVPFVLLVDAKGVVRFQGHPAALDSRRLQQLVGAASE